MQDGIINRRDAETPSLNKLTERVIGACIEIHRALGPGLLESAYEECLCYELSRAGVKFERQQMLPVRYKEVNLDCGYRLDLVIEKEIVVELKSVESLLPIHEAQLLTYLKLSGMTLGLLINFNVGMLKHGIKRIVNNFQDSASPRLCGEIKFG
jgi:GxxExxY protein